MWLKKLGRWLLAVIAAICMLSVTAWFAQSTVTQLSGLAVAENVPTTIWNSVRDAVSGDNLVRGVLAVNSYVFDGTNFDRARGDATNGLDVDVTRITGALTPADATVTPTTLNGVQSFGMVWNGSTWDRLPGSISGSAFFAITDTGIAQVSQNFAFGFTSKKVMVTAPSGNGASICLDWLGATAVCASADTAGDDLIAAGETIILDNYAVTSISAIVGSGTDTITIRAWN